MAFIKLLRAIAGGVDTIIKELNWLACGVLCLMALVVFGNVVGRFSFDHPLLGIVEIVELMMVVIGFFVMPYAAVKQQHVRIELVVSRLPRRLQAILGSISFFLGAGIMAIITYQATLSAIAYSQDLSQATYVLAIPFAPFRAILALGCLLLCLRLFINVFQPLPPEEEQEDGLSK